MSSLQPNRSGGAKQMAVNPALIYLGAAFALVLVASIAAAIMGLAEQARQAKENKERKTR